MCEIILDEHQVQKNINWKLTDRLLGAICYRRHSMMQTVLLNINSKRGCVHNIGHKMYFNTEGIDNLHGQDTFMKISSTHWKPSTVEHGVEEQSHWVCVFPAYGAGWSCITITVSCPQWHQPVLYLRRTEQGTHSLFRRLYKTHKCRKIVVVYAQLTLNTQHM